MKTLICALSAFAVYVSNLCFAPAAEAQQPVTKLVVGEKETYVVGPDNVLKVDTLVMQDKATIQFDPTKYGMLEAKVAIIGNKCLISSKGADGEKGENLFSGENGMHGGNLSVVMAFVKLGKLTIDISGGDGGNGMNGKNGKQGTPDRLEKKTFTDNKGNQYSVTVPIAGEPGTDGTDATMGGNGGDGGRLLLMYSTNGFIPIFNQEGRDKNSIVILHTGGSSGKTGVPGKGGVASVDGTVKPNAFRSAKNGQLQLVILDADTY